MNMNTDTITPRIENLNQGLVALSDRIASHKMLDFITNQTSKENTVKVEMTIKKKNGRYIIALETSAYKKITLGKLLNLTES